VWVIPACQILFPRLFVRLAAVQQNVPFGGQLLELSPGLLSEPHWLLFPLWRQFSRGRWLLQRRIQQKTSASLNTRLRAAPRKMVSLNLRLHTKQLYAVGIHWFSTKDAA